MKAELKRALSILLVCILLFTSCLFFGSCGNKDSNFAESDKDSNFVESNKDSNFVEIKFKKYGSVIIEVYPDIAPETVANFLSLVDEGFYDGLTFHRIYPGFMIQGGDPDGDGTGGSKNKIKGEFSNNGFENNLSHERGVVSMARATDPDSASSQFFICVDDATHLDGSYAAFGRVVEGMDVVDAIVADVYNNPARYTYYTAFLGAYYSYLSYFDADMLSTYACQYSNGSVLSQYQPVIESVKRVAER